MVINMKKLIAKTPAVQIKLHRRAEFELLDDDERVKK